MLPNPQETTDLVTLIEKSLMENSFFVQYVLTTKMVTENPHLTFTKVYILRYIQIKKAKKKKENGKERGELFIDNNILSNNFCHNNEK